MPQKPLDKRSYLAWAQGIVETDGWRNTPQRFLYDLAMIADTLSDAIVEVVEPDPYAGIIEESSPPPYVDVWEQPDLRRAYDD